MNVWVMAIVALTAVAIIVFMLIKKMDIKISLFLMGLLLMYVALFGGNELVVSNLSSTGVKWLDPIAAVVTEFKNGLTSYGFIILMLGGYTFYMSHIGANEVTVSVLTKPMSKIKSPYILVPIAFLVGNLLSLVIPSASTLSIILMATLMPVLLKTGMTTLTAAGVIATTATVMPTPMGSDNVAIAEELAKYPEYAGMTVSEYVFRYHALVSIPTLLFMAVVHYFWQKYRDKKDAQNGITSNAKVDYGTAKEITGGPLYKTVYALLPVLPMLLLIVVFILQRAAGLNFTLSVEVATIISFIIAIICEVVRHKSGKTALQSTEKFFVGMGNGMPVVALTVAAVVFVDGLKSIGLISTLQSGMEGLQGNGMGFVLPLILVLLTALIVLLSGSGTSLFFAMVPLMVPLATAAGISAFAITVPMGLAGNLLRAVSPVAAVVAIVSGTTKENPLAIVKRTSVPMIAGTVFMFILSMIIFL